MKHKIFTLLLAVMAGVGTLFADRVQIGDLYYELYPQSEWHDGNTATAYGEWNDNLISITIPTTVKYEGVTYNVTDVGYFANCSNLTSVNISEGIVNIHGEAFKECSSLVTVKLPESLRYIGYDAFRNCSSLTTINIPDKLEDGYFNSSLQSIFYGCTSLPVHDNIRYAGTCAIDILDYEQSSYTIWNQATRLTSELFQGCTNLQVISIPASLKIIGKRALSCYTLSYITVDANNPNFSAISGVLFDKQATNLIQYPRGKEGAYTIPNSVKCISDYAFSNCDELTSVVIPSNADSIADRAFQSCAKLTSVSLSKGIRHIGNEVFSYCYNLTSINLPEGIEYIGSYVFKECNNLTSLEFPSSLIYLNNDILDDCTGLETIKIPSSVLSIGEYNRQQCENGVWTWECQESYYDEYRYTIAGDLEYNSHGWQIETPNPLPKLKTVEAPTWFFDVPEVNWTSCPKYLEKVVVNRGELNDNVFGVINRSYKTLLSLNVGGVSNTTLSDEAFKDNYNLTELVLPAGLTSVSYMAVAGCKNLKAIDIPASVEVIDQSAFEDCRSIEAITFGGKQPSNVPGRNTMLAATSKLRKIGNWAFYNAHQLQHLEIPEGVEEIGDGAFYGCTYLQDLSLPSSVRSIGDNCFALCSKLEQITVNSTTPPEIRPRTFYDVSRQIPVYVPEDVVEDYQNDELWGQMNIQAGATAVENISAGNASHTKFIRNGQLFILHDGKTYTVQGLEVK